MTGAFQTAGHLPVAWRWVGQLRDGAEDGSSNVRWCFVTVEGVSVIDQTSWRHVNCALCSQEGV